MSCISLMQSTLHLICSLPHTYIHIQIIPFLSNPNESISREALALMKALLFSWNIEVQDGLANHITSTKEETLFISLKKRLDIARINYTEMYVTLITLQINISVLCNTYTCIIIVQSNTYFYYKIIVENFKNT